MRCSNDVRLTKVCDCPCDPSNSVEGPSRQLKMLDGASLEVAFAFGVSGQYLIELGDLTALFTDTRTLVKSFRHSAAGHLDASSDRSGGFDCFVD